MEDRIADILIIGAILTAIILKIVGVITLPWIWLLSPLWLLFGVGCILAIAFTLIVIIEQEINKRRKNK